MSNIDLGDTPVGTEPTEAEQKQLRESIEADRVPITLDVANPRSGSGVEADLLTRGIGTDGSRWIKTGAGDTAWERVMVSDDGEFVASVKLEDVSDSVPDTGVLGRWGNSVRIGNNSATGGIYPLDSSATVTVLANGTPTENGAALLAAITRAKALTPNGAALSNTNRGNIVMQQGIYELTSVLAYDAQFVNLIGLPGAVLTGAEVRLATDNFDIHGLTIDGLSNFMAPDLDNGTSGNNVKVSNCKLNGSFAFSDQDGLYGMNIDVRDSLFIGNNHFFNSSATFWNVEVIGNNAWSGDANPTHTCDQCKAGSGSWQPGFGDSRGKLYHCRLTSGTFPDLQDDSGAAIVLCIDGDDQVVTEYAATS